MEVKVGPKDMGKIFTRIGPAYKDALESALTEAGETIVKELTSRSSGIFDTGAFSQGWTYAISDDRLTLTISNKAPHAVFVEFGRKPGGKMPPFEPLALWADRHGIPRTAVWQISKSIQTRGIKPRPVMFANLEMMISTFHDAVKKHLEEALEQAAK